MNTQIISAFVNLGAVGLILWWMTQKLIPSQMEVFERRMERLQETFKSEAAMERQFLQESLNKILEHSTRMLDLLYKVRE